jgi:uncharacterized protein YhjY with autotransporter beta-barrel domain
MKRITPVLAVAVAVVFAQPAFAVTTNPTNTTEQASTTTTSTAIVSTSSTVTVGNLGTRVGGFLAPQVITDQGGNGDMVAALNDEMGLGDGMSAGGGDGRLGVWVTGGWTGLEDDLVSTAYDGDVFNMMFGGDYQFNDRFLAGVALGYESADIDTTFNTGNVSSNGWTIAPYAGYVLNRYFTMDVSAGYSFVDYDLRRTNALGTTVTGGFESNRWFVAGAVNGYYSVNKILLTGRLGYSYTRESQDGFTESDTTINGERDVTVGSIRIGGTVGYDLGKVQPYLTTTYVYDAQLTKVQVGAGQATPANDRSGVDFGGGVRFALSDRVSGGIEGTTHVARDNFDSTSVSGNLRIKF